MHKNHAILAAGALAILIGLATTSQAAPEKTSLNAAKMSEFLLAGMREQRTLLRSGVFRFTGEKNRKQYRSEFKHVQFGPVQGFCAFDQSLGAYRIDWEEADLVHNFLGNTLVGGKWVRMPAYSLGLMKGSKVVDTLPPTAKPPDWITPFDVRALGLNFWPEFRRGVTLENSLHDYELRPPLAVEEERKGIYSIKWVGDGIYRRWVLTINADQGFTPIRLESFDLQHDAGGLANYDLVEEFVDLTWTQNSGVWVPTTIKTSHPATGNRFEEFTLALDWQSVNQPTSPRYYTEEGIALKEGAALVDEPSGSDGPSDKEAASQPSGDAHADAKEPHSKLSFARIADIIASTVLAVTFLVWLYLKKGRSSGANRSDRTTKVL